MVVMVVTVVTGVMGYMEEMEEMGEMDGTEETGGMAGTVAMDLQDLLALNRLIPNRLIPNPLVLNRLILGMAAKHLNEYILVRGLGVKVLMMQSPSYHHWNCHGARDSSLILLAHGMDSKLLAKSGTRSGDYLVRGIMRDVR